MPEGQLNRVRDVVNMLTAREIPNDLVSLKVGERRQDMLLRDSESRRNISGLGEGTEGDTQRKEDG